MGRVHVASACLLAAFVLAAPASAQQGTAQISGKVTDAQGAVLPGVSVVVRNEETGATRDLTSSAEGTYSAAQLTPGRYAVTAKVAGFQTMERTGLVLLVGTTLTINLTLPVGGIEENVTVTGQSPLVDTTSATRRRQRRHGGAQRAAGDEPQLLLGGRAAARRAVLAVEPDGQRHHRRQRPDLTEHECLGRRRLQRRRCARHELGRAGPDAARSGAGIPGADQHVRRGVRPRQRRDRQRRQQVGHQPVEGRRCSATRRPTR